MNKKYIGRIVLIAGVMMMTSCCITGYCPVDLPEQNQIKEYNTEKR